MGRTWFWLGVDWLLSVRGGAIEKRVSGHPVGNLIGNLLFAKPCHKNMTDLCSCCCPTHFFPLPYILIHTFIENCGWDLILVIDWLLRCERTGQGKERDWISLRPHSLRCWNLIGNWPFAKLRLANTIYQSDLCSYCGSAHFSHFHTFGNSE